MAYTAELTFLQHTLERCRVPSLLWRRDTAPDHHIDLGFRNQFGFANEYARFFREHFQSARPQTMYILCDVFDCHYRFLNLPNDDRVFVVGPYLTDPISDQQIFEHAERIGLPPQHLRALETYYHSLPVLSGAHTLFLMLDAFAETIWKQRDFSVVVIARDTESDAVPVPTVPTSSENTLHNMEILEQRYHYENELMQSVSRGAEHQAELLLANLTPAAMEKRTADPVRNVKNYCIIMNTLLRKAAESGGVHPIYLDRESNEFARRIEQLNTVAASQLLMRDMFRAYCRLVRNTATSHYSPAVQKAIACIDADLSGDLNLHNLAEMQNLNASYLSALFRRETNETLTGYITRKRLQLAQQLLTTTQLQVQTIAQYCGIPDINYFSKLFKRHTGKTPREYRTSQ